MEDTQYVVTDGSTFVDLERDATSHAIFMPSEKALEYTVTNTDARPSPKYRITSTYIADPSLVEVRASTRAVPLGAVARRFAGSDAVLLVGTFDDLNTRGFGFPPEGGEDGGGVAAKCDGPTPDSPGICNCTGKKDCADMSKAGLCTGRGSAVCGKGSNGHWGCSCIAKGS